MNKKYNLVFVVTLLLFMLTISITFISYKTSVNATKKQIINQVLPLSLDNIYNEIQESIIEPYIITSTMGANVFVRNWLINKNKDKTVIFEYLEKFMERYDSYNIYTTFLVDVSTETYYKPHGEYFQLSKKNSYDQWYFDFLESGNKESTTLNFNVTGELTLYHNAAILDDKNNIVGITGIGLRFPYIDRLFKTFRNQHGLIITFYDKNAQLTLCELIDQKMPKKRYQQKYVEHMIQENKRSFEFEKDGEKYFLRMKFIPELDSYLIVESKIDDFTSQAKKLFYINIALSIAISLFILSIVISIIRKYQKQVEDLVDKDPLTELSNRRSFTCKFQDCFDLSKRSGMALSLLFLDLDNFKVINDSLGHATGDKVLKRVSEILLNNTRKTDYVGRWGGEEFVVLFTNTHISSAENVAQKLCELLQQDEELNQLINQPQTGSFGLTQVLNTDENIDVVVARADKAMYTAKSRGKNQVIIS